MMVSEVVYNLNLIKKFDTMLNGFKGMILKAPEGSKKSILIDTTKTGLEVCEAFQKHVNSVQLLLSDNDGLEFEADRLIIQVKEKKTKIIKIKKKVLSLDKQIEE